ncbi:MAG: alpha/beta hydrolase [Methanomassiliicoccales archaeon]
MNLLWVLFSLPIIFGILFLLSCLVLALNKRAMPPPCAFVQTKWGKVHYCERGEGAPVIMLHGSNGSLYDYKLSIMDALAKEFRVIAIDRPGHGHTPRIFWGRDTCSWQGELIKEAWKQLGVNRPILVGHSSAAAVVLDLAIRCPQDISGVVLLSGVVHCFEGDQVPVISIFNALNRRLLGTFLIWTLILPVGRLLGQRLLRFTFAPDAAPHQYRQVGLALALRPSSLKAEAEDLKCLIATLSAIETRYSDIKVPLVLVVGEDDRIVPPEGQSLRLHQEVKGSELILLKRTGHMPMFTQPQAVMEAVRKVKIKVDELSREKIDGIVQHLHLMEDRE